MKILIWLLPLLAAAGVIVYDRVSLRRTLNALDDVLDRAVRGELENRAFDETAPSHLEARLTQYLAASAISAENVAEEREKLKTLVADISHQTRTPLANVLLYAQLLREQTLTEAGRDCAQALEQQAGKLQSLIEALVKTSRLETGVLVMHAKPGNFAPLVQAAAGQFAPRAAEKGIVLEVLSADAQAVFDRKWTEEALCNLLDNAVKYTPSGGRITVETAEFELFSRITVSDTGPGIPEEEQARVFQRFYRSPGVSQAEGVGIGLYLARKIVEGQGGYMKVASKLGQGAAFSMYLPRG